MTSLAENLSATATASDPEPLPPADRRKIEIQKTLGWLLFFPLGIISVILIRYKYKLSIKNLDQVRIKFKELVREKRPILVCSNHLTLVDSIIIIWALAPLSYYFFNYRLFCWNVPEIKNYWTKLSWKIFTYLGKCIPIDRTGSRQHQDHVLDQVSSLVRSGDLCMVFPEGTRSRSGRVVPSEVTYGVGKIVSNVPGCQVLCLYLRGDQQETYSDFPKSGEDFYLSLELITPVSKSKGLRAIRDYSVQIISKIKEMEDAYFRNKNS